jgi:hypothetical protein
MHDIQDEVSELVSISDGLRRQRRKRIREIEEERIVEAPVPPLPPLAAPEPPPPLILERRPRWEEDRTYEREIVIGNRKPPRRPRSLTREWIDYRW